MSKEHTMTETEKLAKAALAVCDRWDTPDWSDHRHTADFIRDLREALTAWNTRPDEGEPVAWRCEVNGSVAWFEDWQDVIAATNDFANVLVDPLYTRPAPALDREGVKRIISGAFKAGAQAALESFCDTLNGLADVPDIAAMSAPDAFRFAAHSMEAAGNMPFSLGETPAAIRAPLSASTVEG